MDHSKQQAKSVFRCRTRRLRGDSGGRKERKSLEGKGRIERRDSKIKAGNQRWKPVLVGCSVGFLYQNPRFPPRRSDHLEGG